MNNGKRFYIKYSTYWEQDVIRDRMRKGKNGMPFTGANLIINKALNIHGNELRKLCDDLNNGKRFEEFDIPQDC
jgi:hypothetical protein